MEIEFKVLSHYPCLWPSTNEVHHSILLLPSNMHGINILIFSCRPKWTESSKQFSYFKSWPANSVFDWTLRICVADWQVNALVKCLKKKKINFCLNCCQIIGVIIFIFNTENLRRWWEIFYIIPSLAICVTYQNSKVIWFVNHEFEARIT